MNVLEFGMAPRAAIDAPRTHHAWFPDVVTLEGKGWSPAVLSTLRSMGHSVRFTDIQGDAQSIIVDLGTGRIHGIADRRRLTEKASGD